MEDVALDVASGLERHIVTSHGPHDAAADNDLVGDQCAVDLPLRADNDALSFDVALHLAVDLHLAGRLQIASNRQVWADHGANCRCALSRS